MYRERHYVRGRSKEDASRIGRVPYSWCEGEFLATYVLYSPQYLSTDQHPLPLQAPYTRCLHWRKDMDDCKLRQ